MPLASPRLRAGSYCLLTCMLGSPVCSVVVVRRSLPPWCSTSPSATIIYVGGSAVRVVCYCCWFWHFPGMAILTEGWFLCPLPFWRGFGALQSTYVCNCLDYGCVRVCTFRLCTPPGLLAQVTNKLNVGPVSFVGGAPPRTASESARFCQQKGCGCFQRQEFNLYSYCSTHAIHSIF